MAPKLFQPPRPSGRPKANTTTTKSGPSTTPTSKAKSKPGPKPGSKRTSNFASKPQSKKPRPSTTSTIRSPSIASSRSRSPSHSPSIDPFSPIPSISHPPSSAAAEEDSESDPFSTRTQHIPPALLARLLHEFFKDEGTRIHKDANAAVGRYVETFVREALARGVFAGEEEGREGMGRGGNVLEVDDLERLAPQLLLDF